MNLQFAPLGKSDLDAVMVIETHSFPQPWTRDMFEREITLAVSHFYSVLCDEKVVGYGGFWQVGDEGHILSIAVDAGYRARGIGRRALQYLCEEMRRRGVGTALLEVRSRNAAARSLYRSEGFMENGIRRRYYTDDDAVLMEKKL